MRFVAARCGLDAPLGVKGESGILHKMETRVIAFFNKCMAKPFRWTYKGKVLAA
ncbi:hypothetical protein [Nannocystis sp. RBIL2]|uniref:hypothetical protein n=1 Tax=unclassified Nannocystis TaxID=2627009 RepID=UPI0032089428